MCRPSNTGPVHQSIYIYMHQLLTFNICTAVKYIIQRSGSTGSSSHLGQIRHWTEHNGKSQIGTLTCKYWLETQDISSGVIGKSCANRPDFFPLRAPYRQKRAVEGQFKVGSCSQLIPSLVAIAVLTAACFAASCTAIRGVAPTLEISTCGFS